MGEWVRACVRVRVRAWMRGCVRVPARPRLTSRLTRTSQANLTRSESIGWTGKCENDMPGQLDLTLPGQLARNVFDRSTRPYLTGLTGIN